MTRFARIADKGVAAFAIVLAGCTSLLPASAAEVDWRWRVSEKDGALMLAVTATEDGTDDTGPVILRCVRASGVARVEAEMTDAVRQAIAEMIRRNEYPAIDSVPSTPNSRSLAEPFFSEIVGWGYSFDISAGSSILDGFRKSGALEYQLGGTPVRHEMSAGLESVARFLDACGKP